MTNTNTSYDTQNFSEENKLPSTLNVLTILTFIGCAFELFSQVKNFFSGTEAIEKVRKAQENMDQMPAFARKFVGPEVLEMMQKSFDNKVPLFIIGLLSIGLCTYGAIEMRKLKKQGYALWLAGEILPVVGSIIFIGLILFKTIFIYFMIFPIIFIILYTTQKKYLIK